MPERRQPERTCVGCRGKGPKPSLLRVVRNGDGVVGLDPTGRAAGRGAYVHPDAGCLMRATRHGSLARALRAPLAPAQAASLMQEVRTMLGDG